MIQEQQLQSESLSSLSGVKLVVVDDNADTRLLFTFIFEDCGAEVIAVGSAQAAIAAVEQLKPHVLISDIHLPGEDGYSLIRRIRSLNAGEWKRILAIAVTGAQQVDQVNNPSAEFQLYLTKPVEPGELVAATVALVRLKAA